MVSTRVQTKQNLFFCLLMSFLGLVYNVLHTLADKVALGIGLQAEEAGIFISIFAAGSLLSLLLSSSWADRVGKRQVIAMALLMMVAGFVLLYLPIGRYLVFLGVFLFGFGFAPAEALSSAVLGDENGQEGSRWMNIAHAGFGVGSILGPALVVGWLLMNLGYQSLFLVLGIVSLLLFLYLKSSQRKLEKPPVSPHTSLNLFELLKSRQFTYLALGMLLYMGFETVAPVYIKQLFLQKGESEALSSLMISLFWGLIILGRLVGAALSGREVLSVRAFTAVALLGLVLLVISKSLWLLMLAVVLYGFGCGPTWPTLVGLATRLYPERSGAAVGLMMVFSMSGMLIFPSLIGTLPGDPIITFFICIGLTALLIALTFLMKPENKG